MEFRKMVTKKKKKDGNNNPVCKTAKETQMYRTVLWTLGEGEGGMIWENGIETCILSHVKQITSPDSMHDTGCSGLVHWDDPEGWYEEEVGGGFRMGSTCTPVVDSCQCIAKPIQYCKVISLQLK